MMFEKNNLAVANAKKIIEKYYIKEPQQYTIEQIINAEGLIYREANLEGCAGSIVFSELYGVITVNAATEPATQKRFTAAHELGHFENEKVKFKACAFEDVMNIRKNNPAEMAANDFAAELLMHDEWFLSYTKTKKLNAVLLKDCANYFNVSLSAGAIRYSEIGPYPCAVVLSKDGFIKWSSINKSFPHQFIRWGKPVSELSYTFDYFNGDPIPEDGEDVPARTWFRESFKLKNDERVFEFNIPFPKYESILTVLFY